MGTSKEISGFFYISAFNASMCFRMRCDRSNQKPVHALPFAHTYPSQAFA